MNAGREITEKMQLKAKTRICIINAILKKNTIIKNIKRYKTQPKQIQIF